MQLRKFDDPSEDLSGPNDGSSFTNKTLARLHDFYLVGEIGEPGQYTSWFETIRGAKENDVVYLHINSPGGNGFTALQLIRCMQECKGTIIASVEGMCLSAATFIFLSSDQCEISEHSMFMFHNYSGMAMGKGGEMFDHVSASRKWSTKLLHSMYKGFLETEEIESILGNKDLWMDADEVIERLKKRKAERIKEHEAEVKAETKGEKETTPPQLPLPKTKSRRPKGKKAKSPIKGVARL